VSRPPDTKFHIDFDWWDKSELDLKTYLFSRLDLGDESSLDMGVEQVDLVDENTGEVRTVDGFQYALQAYFSRAAGKCQQANDRGRASRLGWAGSGSHSENPLWAPHIPGNPAALRKWWLDRDSERQKEYRK